MASKQTNISTNVKEKYRDTLDEITKARYLKKLQEIENKDPYETEEWNLGDWSADISTWPTVTYPDIVNYLVYTLSVYTLAELKAYKSLQGYNYFVSGFVLEIKHTVVNDRSVFIGKVKHSQRMNDTSLRPWLIVERNGSVISGHCTCMAGIGEVCSHVGALLFAVEASVKIRNSKTVTEEKAYWLLPSAISKVQYKTIQDIDFTSAKMKKKQLDKSISTGASVPGLKQRKLPTVNEPSTDELSDLFFALSRTGKKPVILSLIPGYASNYKPKALDKKYPKVLSELFDDTFTSIGKEKLIEHCHNLFMEISVSEEEALNCKTDTQLQSNSKQWFSFRTGRITASRMKAACRTSVDNPSKSLLKEICYPASKSFSSTPTTWGCDHEKDARKQYMKGMIDNHENFQWQDSGLVINPKYPFMGATPDGIGSCDCCGDIVVEIKCPYCHRHSQIDDTVDCLEMRDDKLCLKRNHSYHYQVQCQLLLTNMEFCDFLVWTEVDLFTERILFDEEFCIDMVKKAEQFFKLAVLPELVGKLYSRPSLPLDIRSTNYLSDSTTTENIICTCRTVYKESDNVIGCDNENCPYVWLHFKCAGIKRVPKGNWFCKECKKKNTEYYIPI